MEFGVLGCGCGCGAMVVGGCRIFGGEVMSRAISGGGPSWERAQSRGVGGGGGCVVQGHRGVCVRFGVMGRAMVVGVLESLEVR